MNDDSHSTPPSQQHRTWLDKLSDALLREPQDREQLIALLRDAQQRELIDDESLTMIEGVLQVSNMQVRDIMVPRAQMAVIDQEAELDNILPIVIDSEHSRYPVIGENRDKIIGVLLAKDLLAYSFHKNRKPFSVSSIMRPAIFVPESKRLDALLREFRLTHNHMAIVVDEYGGVAGLVTIEDVLEQIVGDIEDETDVDEEPFIKQHESNVYIIQALTPVEDFNSYFNEQWSDEEFDTIGGIVIGQFGHLPQRGEETSIEGYHFKVLHADNRRIRLLEVITPE